MTSSFAFEIAARSTVVLALALTVLPLLRRRSAAERHFVLALALGAIVLLPAGFVVLPGWNWPVRQSSAEKSEFQVRATVESSDSPAPAAVVANFASVEEPGLDLWLGAYALGAGWQFVWLAVGSWRLHGIRRRSRMFAWREGVAAERPAGCGLRLSDETRVAFLTGVVRPVIVLPGEAAAWPAEQLGMVLDHEFAHLRRRDHWLLPWWGAVRVLYWWHPLAWLALAFLRRERERACDDLAIAGCRATDYAELLLQAARAAMDGKQPRATLAMASGSHLGSRVRAVLDPARSRRGTGFGLGVGVAAAGLAVLLLASSVRLVTAAEDEEGPRPRAIAPEAGGRPVKVTAEPSGEKDVAIEGKLFEVGQATADRLRGDLDPVMNAKGAVAPEIFASCLRALDQTKGVDLLSAPTVRTKAGTKAKIELTREFKYGVDFEKDAAGEMKPRRFETRKTGVELEVEPTMSHGRIVLNGLVRVTDFEGMIEGDGGVEMPVFDVKEARFLREVGDGESAGVWAWSRTDKQKVNDRDPVSGVEKAYDQVITRRLGILLTARTGSAKAASVPDRPPAAAPAATGGEKRYATPAAGPPGFVTSPYAPDEGEVDVRGIPPQTEVKCPYTGKIFLVP